MLIHVDAEKSNDNNFHYFTVDPFFLDFFVFIGKTDYREERERETKIFHLLDPSPSDLRPGARIFFQGSHAGIRFQGSRPSSAGFLGHTLGAGLGAEQLGCQPALIWDLLNLQVKDLTTDPMLQALTVDF